MYDNNNKGVLFPEQEKETDKHPDFTGNINVNGKDYRLAGWKRQTKTGGHFLSLAVSEKRVSESKSVPKDITDEDISLDDIPF